MDAEEEKITAKERAIIAEAELKAELEIELKYLNIARAEYNTGLPQIKDMAYWQEPKKAPQKVPEERTLEEMQRNLEERFREVSGLPQLTENPSRIGPPEVPA